MSGLVAGQPVPLGIALTNQTLQRGTARIGITFDSLENDDRQGGGLVFGYRSPNERYVMAQLASSGAAYSFGEFLPGFGWQALITAGEKANLRPKRKYLMEVSIRGQRIRLDVDGVRVFEQVLRAPLHGKQVAVIAAGASAVHFTGLEVESEKPRVFVAMQFGEPFDTIYTQVIKPSVRGLDLEVVRIDEIAGPGIIFDDIQRNISEANIIIAEITAPNQNVFYELGYAHALNKPTILLAKRGRELPFDIRSYRVIFYDDTIGGKPAVEDSLEKHLRAVVQDL